MSEQIKGKIKVGCNKDQKAFLIETEEYGEIWIPKSQIEWTRNYSVKIYITDWIAYQKEIITEEEFERRQNKPEPQNGPEQGNLPF